MPGECGAFFFWGVGFAAEVGSERLGLELCANQRWLPSGIGSEGIFWVGDLSLCRVGGGFLRSQNEQFSEEPNLCFSHGCACADHNYGRAAREMPGEAS